MPSPFVPPNEDNFTQKIVTEAFRDENDEKFKESLTLIEKPKIQSLFDGYYYDYQTAVAPTKYQISSGEKSEEKSNPEIQEEYQFDK